MTAEQDHPEPGAGAIARRAVLAGLAGGTAGAVLGVGGASAATGSPSAPPAAVGTPVVGQAAGVGRAIPPPVAGARMLGISGWSFSTWGYSAGSSASVITPGSAGVGSSDDGNRLRARLDLPSGARIVRIDVAGHLTSAGTQFWYLVRTDPTTFTDVEIDSLGASRGSAGTVSGVMAPNHTVEAGYDYGIVADSGSNGPLVKGVVVQYVAPGGSFVAIPPRRVHDSRSGGKIIGGTEREVSVATEVGTGTEVVPPEATAVAVNLTVTSTENAGWLALRPFGQPATGTSSVNWSATGQTDSNETPVQLGGDRSLIVRAGGSGVPRAHFILDVVGYFV